MKRNLRVIMPLVGIGMAAASQYIAQFILVTTGYEYFYYLRYIPGLSEQEIRRGAGTAPGYLLLRNEQLLMACSSPRYKTKPHVSGYLIVRNM